MLELGWSGFAGPVQGDLVQLADFPGPTLLGKSVRGGQKVDVVVSAITTPVSRTRQMDPVVHSHPIFLSKPFREQDHQVAPFVLGKFVREGKLELPSHVCARVLVDSLDLVPELLLAHGPDVLRGRRRENNPSTRPVDPTLLGVVVQLARPGVHEF